MPKVKIGNTQIYYEVHGQGYPLVLIRGLGSNADHWYEQVPEFSKHYQVVTFDNRGIARSNPFTDILSIEQMAHDTVGLMHSLNIAKAHILGFSMGGMIAQRIAIDYPERVSKLILVSTHCGGKQQVLASQEPIDIFDRYINNPNLENASKAAEALYASETIVHRKEVIKKYFEVSGKYSSPVKVLKAQAKAISNHNTWKALSSIGVKTLVLTGTEDVLVPPENSRILAERIPNAELAFINKGGHQVLIEQSYQSNNKILDFLVAADYSSKNG